MGWADPHMLGCRQTRRQSRSARAACGALLGPVAFAFVLAFVVGCAPTPATSATVRVTPTSVPTATAMPCPTPAGTTSATQTRLAAAVAAAVGSVPCLDTAYQPRDHTALVTVTIGGLVPTTPTAIAAAQERAKVLSFQAQRALWTSGVSLTGATVAVLGPYLDPYNGPTIAPYTSAYLTAHTAATFAWANLSPDTAWTKYNSTFLRPGFAPADGVPTPTPTA